MENWHDLFLMVMTAGGIFGAIRYDLKFLRFQYKTLTERFEAHIKDGHGGQNANHS
jgi:hypothetical protein